MSLATIEECVDELDGFVEANAHFPEPVLAMALRIHLAALLRALLESGALARSQAQDFLTGLQREVFEHEND